MMAALAAAMPVSGAIAWLLLLSVFPREAPGRLIATSAMVVAYPYAALLVYAAGYAASPIGRFDQWHVQWYLMAVLALTSSAVLSILGWLFFARGAKQYRRTLGAIIVTASIAGLCLVVSGHEQVTAEALRNSFAHAMPVIIPASFLFALLILRAQSGPDSMAKALFGAVMVAQFACVLPIFAAVGGSFGLCGADLRGCLLPLGRWRAVVGSGGEPDLRGAVRLCPRRPSVVSASLHSHPSLSSG